MKKINILTLLCGRYDLYEKSWKSVIENVVDKNKNYNFHFYVNDDSGESKINYKFNELLKKYLPEGNYNFFASSKNLGQSLSMVNLVKKANIKDEELIFQIEEDFVLDEPVDIEKNIKLWQKIEKEYNVKIMQVIFRTDAHTNFEMSSGGLRKSRKNIFKYLDNKFITCSNEYKDKIEYYGGSIINNDFCCHPHLSRGYHYNKLKNRDLKIEKKSTAEDLIGNNNLEYLKLWINDKIYSSHIGEYRYYSVFEGAKVRSQTSTKIDKPVEIKKIK